MGADRRSDHAPGLRRRHRRHRHRHRPLPARTQADLEVIGADPEGSIYSGGPESVRPYLVEGVGEDFWPQTFDPSVVDRWITVSDRDAFLTTRRLALTEGILAGGSGGLAVHAALQVAAEVEDPEAMIVVILPDGGRSYLSKIYSDSWMRQYGFLERDPKLVVGDVLRRKRDAGEIPPLVTVETHHRVRDAVSLLHEHRVSQLPVVSPHDPATVVGAISERGLLKQTAADPSRLDAEIVEVMEPPFAAVSTEDPVREAVELLVGDQQALLVMDHGPPARESSRGRTCWKHWLRERARAAARRVRDPGRPRRPEAGPDVRLGHPGHPPDEHVRAAAAGRVRRRLRLRALREPDARRARAGARRARRRTRGGVRLWSRRRARADHRRLRGRVPHRASRRPLRRHLPAGRQGARSLGAVLRPRQPVGPRRARAGRPRRTRD